MWERIKQVVKQVKGLYDWYSFGSAIVSWIILTGLFSGVGVSVVGVVTAVIKGVPWPITLMAGFAVFIAIGCLAATPLIIRAAIQSITPVTANKFRQPITPHWDAWKHVEKFTVREAAYLLENLEPSTHSRDTKIQARISGLCAAIRTGDLDLFKKLEEGLLPLGALMEPEIMRQRAQANWQTVIPKEALMDFAKRNKMDLKHLDQ
jgi:hypothetical protein